MNNQEITEFFGLDNDLIEKTGISHEEILFAIKLQSSDIQKKKLQPDQKKKSLTVIKSIFKTIINNNYLICYNTGKCIILSSDNENPRIILSFSDLQVELCFAPAAMNCSIKVVAAWCPIETIFFSYKPSDKILGNVSEMFKLFGAKLENNDVLTTTKNEFYRVSIYRQNIDDEQNAFSFVIVSSTDTLITSSGGGLHLHNMDVLLDYSKIVAYSYSHNVYSIVTLEDETLKLYSIFAIPSGIGGCPLDSSTFDDIYKSNCLVFQDSASYDIGNLKLLSLPLPKDKVAEFNLFAVYFRSDCVNYLLVISDNKLKIGSDQDTLKQFSLFYYEDDLYLQNAENELIILTPPVKVIRDLTGLDMRFEEYLLDYSKPQYLIQADSGIAQKAQLYTDKLVISDIVVFFHDVDMVKFNPEPGCAKIEMITGNQVSIYICAFDFAFMLWKNFEHSNLSKLKLMTFNEIQSYLNNIIVNRFLYAVFGEIIITNNEVNEHITVIDLLTMISDREGNTLRSLSNSLVNKFKSVDDLQEIVLRKISAIEYHKNRILILTNEWNLIYPHYMGNTEYKRMKLLFSAESISQYDLDRDRLDVVESIRKIVQNISSNISSMLSNIDKPITKIYGMIPPQIKVEKSTFASRFTSKNVEFQSGTVVGGFKLITQLSDALARGIILTDMSSLVFSPVSNILSHFAKDSQERRDLKVYGQQILEWWELIMKYHTFLIVEARQMFTKFVESRISVYTKYMENMNENEKKALIEKYFSIIEGEIKDLIDEKFHPVEEKKVYLQNVVDQIEEIESHYSEYIDDFVTKQL